MAEPDPPLPWIVRFAPLVPPGAPVLDVACGRGRHTRFLLGRGHPVTAVDIDLSGLAGIAGHPALQAIAADLEDGSPWPLPGRRFGAVVVTDYLWRPLLPVLIDAVDDRGLVLYETFGRGNEAFGRPTRPEFLLCPGELLEAVRGKLMVVAYEHGLERAPRPAVRQRLCAIRSERPVRLD